MHQIRTQLNENHTFRNFVSFQTNEFAFKAAKAVAGNPGAVYNPLVIHGGTGLGKTHLLQAIAHECFSKHSNLKIVYVLADVFSNELIASIRYEKMLEFREKYNSVDLLLFDDFQSLANKEVTQREFCNIFNELFEKKKQIVIAGINQGLRSEEFNEKLISRLQRGLVADIQPPQPEDKYVLLKSKAAENNINLPDAVAGFLSEKAGDDIRQLEGLLIRLSAYTALLECDITINSADEALKAYIDNDREHTSSENTGTQFQTPIPQIILSRIIALIPLKVLSVADSLLCKMVCCIKNYIEIKKRNKRDN